MTNQTAASAVTLDAFAAKVGCHFTTASRLKAGDRLPSIELLSRIILVYGLDANQMMEMVFSTNIPKSDRRDAFGRYLRQNIFNVKDEPDAA